MAYGGDYLDLVRVTDCWVLSLDWREETVCGDLEGVEGWETGGSGESEQRGGECDADGEGGREAVAYGLDLEIFDHSIRARYAAWSWTF